jgi:quercetin dioxygenase-like cupin family protein
MTSTTTLIQPQPADHIALPGTRRSVILSTEYSNGHLTIFEEEMSVGACMPAHICNRQDKVILVTDGKFALFANDKMYEAEKGCNIFIPRGVKHYFKNIGTQTGKLLTTLTPCGPDNFLRDLCLNVKVFRKDPAVMYKVAKKNGVVLV